MDDFWLPKVSGALGTGKRGGKNPSQFQHVVSPTIISLFTLPFYYCIIVPLYLKTIRFQIEGVKASEQRRKNFPHV